MHNLEEKPRTHLIGVRWGYCGAIAGLACGLIAIASQWVSGDATSYEVGTSMGAIGLIAGVSCAFIGWASARA